MLSTLPEWCAPDLLFWLIAKILLIVEMTNKSSSKVPGGAVGGGRGRGRGRGVLVRNSESSGSTKPGGLAQATPSAGRSAPIVGMGGGDCHVGQLPLAASASAANLTKTKQTNGNPPKAAPKCRLNPAIFDGAGAGTAISSNETPISSTNASSGSGSSPNTNSTNIVGASAASSSSSKLINVPRSFAEMAAANRIEKLRLDDSLSSTSGSLSDGFPCRDLSVSPSSGAGVDDSLSTSGRLTGSDVLELPSPSSASADATSLSSGGAAHYQIAIRPGFGTQGRVVSLRTNHFEVQIPRGIKIYCYDVVCREQQKSPVFRTPVVSTNRVEQDNIKLRRYEAFNALVAKEPTQFPDRLGMFFNAHKLLYSVKKLPCCEKLNNKSPATFVNSLSFTSSQYQWSFQLAGNEPVALDNMLSLIERDELTRNDKDRNILAILDIMFNQHFYDLKNNLNLIPAGRAFYGVQCTKLLNNGRNVLLGSGREMAQGLFKAHNIHLGRDRRNKPHPCDPTFSTIDVNLDIASTAFYQPQPLLDYIKEFAGRGRDRILPAGQWDDRQIRLLKQHLTGVLVECRYAPGGGREERVQRFEIKDVSRGSAKTTTFERNDRVTNLPITTTVHQYFSDEYGLELRMPNLPLVADKHIPLKNGGLRAKMATLGGKRVETPCYFPIEFCHIVKNQRVAANRMKDAALTSAMIKSTAVPPAERVKRLQTIIDQVGLKDDPYLNYLGINRLLSFMTIVGRVIDAPQIQLLGPRADNKVAVNVARGVFKMNNNRYFMTGKCHQYFVISFDDGKFLPEGAAYKYFCQNFVEAGEKKGIEFGNRLPALLKDADGRGHSYVRYDLVIGRGPITPEGAREFVFKILGLLSQQRIDVTLVVVILPANQDREIKPHVKQIASEFGMITQCINATNAAKIARFDRGADQLLENIMHKVNSRLGGKNWKLLDQAKILTKYLSEDKPTMFLGADVAHPPPKAHKDLSEVAPSVVSVVASADTLQWAFNPIARVQKTTRQEYIDNMREIMIEQLTNFFEQVGKLPSRIVMYRDGVGRGMYQEVLNRELGGIKSACEYMDEFYNPPITYVLTIKRHHTRLFKDKFIPGGRDTDNNVDPGTVADTGPVHPTDWEFFLCSHLGLKGTSRPTKYHVLYDENGFSANEIQSLTYFLCHVFHRCTRAISLPAPAAMAHHFADHITQLLTAHKNIMDNQSQSDTSDLLGFDEKELQEVAKKYVASFKNKQFFL